MQLSKVTMALAAAGFGAALATGYQHLDAPAVSVANAAVTAPAFTAPPVAPTAAARLPDFTALVDKAGAAVVNISTTGKVKQAALDQDEIDPDNPFGDFLRRFGMPQGPQGQPRMMPSRGVGSGFIVSPDGYIVTNAHVVDGANEVTVRLTDRREFTAKVIGADKRTDIALIKIDGKNLPALDLSAPPPVKRGEWVIAIGSPFGFENSVSAGIVSGVHRALPGGQMTPFIQTDVAVNPGNSGGPLLNSAGQVVGVNSQIYSRSGGYMGLSFAIPADVAAKVADQLRTHGKVAHGRIGVGIQPLDQSLAQSFGLPDSNGALVGTVEKDSPASKAGFKSGDIIRKIDGEAVTDSTDVTSRIGNMAPGTKTQIEVWRDGKPVTLATTIGTLDDEKVASNAPDKAERGGKLGLAARPLTPDEKSEVGHDGLVVENATGPAALAGVQAGDVIVGVGTAKVRTVDELRKLVEKSGKTVALLIERDGRQIYVPIRVG
ncbi:MAG TPA: Do family serine endopeptidase [Casimicrobiaceae bacterium]|nr:Do family serine endopeptidase [Casimicrobiaceae bacterium]